MPSQSTSSDAVNYTRDCGEFFSWFDICYDDDKPSGSIEEISGQSADINKGHGGSYVWLTVRRAPKPTMMVDKIWTDIRSNSDGGRKDDLAKGAGGPYRYFSWSNNMNANNFVTDVALWRSSDAQGNPPNGWHHKSDDINEGRGGDYLYLVWRTKSYYGPRSP
ncbi:hypothetical protein M406DRAFT_73640 [Cryphonectria parasitica EP155]|uniref:Uncharacterized protein n=1 Tax=Cryphonectria parasitica (strain ATCC 38755 / EP155) TaxID=660469 RepID=A0A9P4XV62_CRYP1|nr:uncharacterized protein M406DRAFT_73640 [Cryphonectria parasitica EP155]KAF3761205.1 hypothetical protein M406DRAFT_73640 [Cryphonectria parasitica EP155]